MDPLFDPRFPYPSVRHPVLADAVVATSQPLAARAGLQMLELGGNAIDAAFAAAIALPSWNPPPTASVATPSRSSGTARGCRLNASRPRPARAGAERFEASTRFPDAAGTRSPCRAPSRPGSRCGGVTARLPLDDPGRAGRPLCRARLPGRPGDRARLGTGGRLLGDQPGFAEAFLVDGRAPRGRRALPARRRRRTLRRSQRPRARRSTAAISPNAWPRSPARLAGCSPRRTSPSTSRRLGRADRAPFRGADVCTRCRRTARGSPR